MKLLSFKVQNYRSLKDVEIDPSNLTILVGRNDSGKSNALKALDLFFNWYASNDVKETITENNARSRRITPFSSRDIFEFAFESRDLRLFHLQEPCVIVFRAVLELNPQENVLPQFVRIGNATENFDTTALGNKVMITANVTVAEQTVRASVLDIKLGSLELLKPPEAGDQRALTKRDDGTYEFLLINSIDQNVAFKLLKEHVRGRFVHIPATRELSREPRTTDAASPSGDHMPSQYLRYEKDVSMRKRPVYDGVRRDMAEIFPEYENTASMEDGEQQVEIYFEGYPSTSVGEGVKKHFVLSFELESNPNSIFGIEEPEIHFHPSKQREVYEFLLKRSIDQQLFVTTHSSVIASNARMSDIRLVSMNQTKITTVGRIDESAILTIMDELGVRPSDFFDSDCVTFVEGASDVGVFSTLTARLVPSARVSFLETEGWTNMQYYANTRVLASRRLHIEPFLIFDGDTSKSERNARIKANLTSRINLQPTHVMTLSKNSIEDYLLIPRAIKAAIPSLTATVKQISDFIQKNSSKANKKAVLDAMFKRYGASEYKETSHAKRIAQTLNDDEIDPELSGIIRTIAGSR
jgi:predicted ATPase